MSEHTPAPRDNTSAIRARSELQFRAAGDTEEGIGDGYLGLLRIRFSPVGEWTEINSAWEGRFMERFAPNAWKKTIRERADKIRALFQHGHDPQIGDKPLGPFHRLEEDDNGGYAEVKLLDTSYNRDLLPGLKEGLYGSSHRFGVVKAEENDRPERSAHNPDGIKEVTIKEARLHELGPVTFPAYAGATSGMRSMTDEFILACFRSDPDRLRAMFARSVDLEFPQVPLDAANYTNHSTWKKATIRSLVSLGYDADSVMKAIESGDHDRLELVGRDAAPEGTSRDEQQQEQDPAPSSTDAAPQGTSGPERRDPRRKGRYGLAKTDPRPSWAL